MAMLALSPYFSTSLILLLSEDEYTFTSVRPCIAPEDSMVEGPHTGARYLGGPSRGH
jgi:hypothetical protein